MPMQNVDAKVEGDVLTLTVDLTQVVCLSRIDKVPVVAKTVGPVRIGDFVIGLYVRKEIE